jgi:hypothetical protein
MQKSLPRADNDHFREIGNQLPKATTQRVNASLQVLDALKPTPLPKWPRSEIAGDQCLGGNANERERAAHLGARPGSSPLSLFDDATSFSAAEF